MKCVAILLVVSFTVAVYSDPNPEVHRVTHRIPGETRIEGGEKDGEVHRIPGEKRIEGGRKVHRIPGEERIEGGGKGGKVHRVTHHTHTHRIPGEGGRTIVKRGGERGAAGAGGTSGAGEGGRTIVKRGGGGGAAGAGGLSGGGGGAAGAGGPPGGRKVPSGPGGKKGGKNGDTTCRNAGLTNLADHLNGGLQGIVNGVANTLGANDIKPGLIGHLLGGVQTTVDNTVGGLDQGVSDFFCGFNRVFNKIGSKLGEGKVLGGVLSGLNQFITGAGSFFGNLGQNAIGAVTSGVSDLVHGRRSKKPDKIVHSQHGQ